MADPKTYTEDEVAAIVAERDAIKANRDEALTEAKKAKAALKSYDGVDATEYKALKEAAAEAERKRALAEGNLDAWKKQVTDAHQAERAGDAKKIDKLTRALEKHLVDAQLATALAKNDADPSMLPLLKLEGRNYARMRETDDDFEAIISDAKGNQLVADGKGTPMTIEDLVVQRLKTQYPAAFRGTGSSGGGASKSTGGASGGGGIVTDGQSFLRNLDKIASGEMTVPVTQ